MATPGAASHFDYRSGALGGDYCSLAMDRRRFGFAAVNPERVHVEPCQASFGLCLRSQTGRRESPIGIAERIADPSQEETDDERQDH